MATIVLDRPDAVAKPRRRLTRNPLVMAAIALVIALAGIAWLVAPRSSETTDNAYIKADSSSIAPKVGGLVSAILVRDNQAVAVGTPLVRIDGEDYDAKVSAARAALADADAGLASARAALTALDADQRLAAARLRSSMTAIASADADYVRAQADQARFDALTADGFATRRDAERVRAEAVGAHSNRDKSRAERDVSVEQVAVTRARLPGLQAAVAEAVAVRARAQAALDLALQDKRHTLVVAPIAGVVGNRQVQTGDYVQPGSRLFTVVPIQSVYVVANFKETQTRHMIVGQRASVSVDALGGKPLTGHVESFAPGSGSEFTLLPYEPGTGNFTKIVQRVPVRIALDPGQPPLARLRPGLSVTASVSLR